MQSPSRSEAFYAQLKKRLVPMLIEEGVKFNAEQGEQLSAENFAEALELLALRFRQSGPRS